MLDNRLETKCSFFISYLIYVFVVSEVAKTLTRTLRLGRWKKTRIIIMHAKSMRTCNTSATSYHDI